MKKNKIIPFKQPETKGRQVMVGFPAKEFQPGKLWASRAEEMATSLLGYNGYNLEVVNSEESTMEADEEIAVFDFFARYDTVYILAFHGIPITTMVIKPDSKEEAKL